MKKSNIIIAISFIIITLVLIFPTNSTYASNLEQQLDSVHNQRQDTLKKIEDAKKLEKEYIGQVEQVEGQFLTALSELNDLNEQLSKVKADIDKTTIDLVVKERELNDIEKDLDGKLLILNNRVAAIYKNGSTNLFEIVLGAENFIEFLSRMKLMNLLADQDTKIIEEVRDKRNATISIKQSIIDLRDMQTDQKTRVEKLLSQAESKKKEVEILFDEKKELLSETKANKEALVSMERQLAAKENEIKRALESLRHGNAPGGKLAFPTAGRVGSGFGNRRHPIFGTMRFHSGVDIYAPTGTPIIAAEAGEVLQTGYHGGYGNAIMIYHGGGFATYYAHLSGFAVRAGQNVSRGQVIGYVGSTGWSTGPHLHFEVRINGAPQNPMGYF